MASPAASLAALDFSTSAGLACACAIAACALPLLNSFSPASLMKLSKLIAISADWVWMNPWTSSQSLLLACYWHASQSGLSIEQNLASGSCTVLRAVADLTVFAPDAAPIPPPDTDT